MRTTARRKTMEKTQKIATKTLVLVSVLTALVIVLQLLGSFIRFGMFSITLVLVPIIIGAAICGPGAGAWLGFAFGMAVLLSGDAASFMAIDPFGTVVTVLVKGTAAGFLAGLIYKALASASAKVSANRTPSEKERAEKTVSALLKYLPVVVAAVVCPVVNTGVFLIGCKLFFYETITEWGLALGFANAAEYMFVGLAGINFIVELVTNMILVPVIVKLLSINNKMFKF